MFFSKENIKWSGRERSAAPTEDWRRAGGRVGMWNACSLRRRTAQGGVFAAWLLQVFGIGRGVGHAALRSSSAVARACLKIAFCKMCVTVCGKLVPKAGGVAGYAD